MLRMKWDPTGEYHRRFLEYLHGIQFNAIDGPSNGGDDQGTAHITIQFKFYVDNIVRYSYADALFSSQPSASPTNGPSTVQSRPVNVPAFETRSTTTKSPQQVCSSDSIANNSIFYSQYSCLKLQNIIFRTFFTHSKPAPLNEHTNERKIIRTHLNLQFPINTGTPRPARNPEIPLAPAASNTNTFSNPNTPQSSGALPDAQPTIFNRFGSDDDLVGSDASLPVVRWTNSYLNSEQFLIEHKLLCIQFFFFFVYLADISEASAPNRIINTAGNQSTNNNTYQQQRIDDNSVNISSTDYGKNNPTKCHTTDQHSANQCHSNRLHA